MVTLAELVELIKPERTVLFLGAGASVPSGAPTGVKLASTLCQMLANGEQISDDLMEVCSILEIRYGRDKLVSEVRAALKGVESSGALLTLPEFDWNSIYTTNFDQLLESAYRHCTKLITPIRSNFDYGKSEASEGTPLFKLHGCISEDIVDGHKARMVLTERDYEEYSDYRETLFRRLDFDMATKDVLVIGHSLRDPHLRRSMNEAAELHRKKAAPGKLYALIYNEDPDRARLLERKGFNVSFGGIDEFLHELTTAHPVAPSIEVEEPTAFQLPPRLLITTIDVKHARTLQPNPVLLFHGRPATYADVANGLTIQRTKEEWLVEQIGRSEKQFLTIIGVAGVGKTTLARRVLRSLVNQGFLGWEHRSDFPFRSGEWIDIERRLRDLGLRGALLVDECPEFLRQVNLLAENIAKVDRPALYVLLTANRIHWLPRTKNRELFAKGIEHRLSELTEEEIEGFVNLIINQPTIGELVEPEFSRLSRLEQVQRLRNRCRADMYVCLKNIFATEDLDAILLREYASLSHDLQDIYRHVSALEASGTRVHRQLILKVLNIAADKIKSLLSLLEGLIDEFDIKTDDGLYGWETRHPVIAQTIAQYKFSDQDELFSLLQRVIDQLNPTIWLELRTLRDLCNYEFGIGRLTDHNMQLELYQRLIRIAPGERVPHHRLIAKYLHIGELEKAAQAIRVAEENVGIDSPIFRYKVRLAMQRAETTEGILEEDRLAILREATRIAMDWLEKRPMDKWAYMSYGDVGIAIAQRSGNTETLDDAIMRTRNAVDDILDPQLPGFLRSLERERRRFSVKSH